MIHACDRWGPFAPHLDPAEYLGLLRCLRAIVHLTTGPRGQATTALLRQAERDPGALPGALASLNAMTANDRRHVWASYAVLSRSA